MVGKGFGKKLTHDFANTLDVKTFVDIALSHNISEINALLHFMPKFKMATKNGGKMILGKNGQMTFHC